MRRDLLLVLIFQGVIGGCGGSTGVLSPPPAGPAPAADQIDGRLQLGSGIISPNRIVAWPDDSTRVLVATGEGESFGQSFLYVLSTADFADLRDRLAVGRNVSDVAWVGNRILVAARSSQELYLIDPDGWRVVDALTLDFPPISIAPLFGPFAAVSSTGFDAGLIRVDLSDDTIKITKQTRLPSFARDISYDAVSDSILALSPLLGIVILDATGLDIIDTVPIATTLSFGSVVWNGYLVAADRDGYVHLLDLSTRVLQTIDLADVLGLDRSALALRGIDPVEVVPIGTTHLAVLDQRQDSVVLAFDPSRSIPLVRVATFPSAVSGTYVSASKQILWANSAGDSIGRLQLPADYVNGAVETSAQIIGTRILDAVALTGVSSGLIAVLDSKRRLVIADSYARIVSDLSANGDRWRPPLAAGPQGSVLAVGSRSDDGLELSQLDVSGTLINEYPLTVSPVFSVRATEDRILAVSRLDEEVQLIDVPTGASSVLRLSHKRPRLGIMLTDQRAIVLHDTMPDIGQTLLNNGREQRFVGSQLDSWWSDGFARQGELVACTFGGSIASFDSLARLHSPLYIDFPGVKQIAPGAADSAWVVSEDLGAALQVSLRRRSITRRIDMPELIKLYESEPGRAWLVTQREVVSVRL